MENYFALSQIARAVWPLGLMDTLDSAWEMLDADYRLSTLSGREFDGALLKFLIADRQEEIQTLLTLTSGLHTGQCRQLCQYCAGSWQSQSSYKKLA